MAKVLGHEFEGPHSIDANFNHVAGVYIIADDGGLIVDVGETGSLANRIPGHERRPGWAKHGGTRLWFHHEPSYQKRLTVEGMLRDHFDPPCGEK